MEKIKIFIADDHPVIRDGIKTYFSDFPDFTVVGEAGNGTKTIEALPSLKPDIVIMDISMPNPDGIQVTKLISKEFPKTKVIIFSMHNERNYAIDAFRAGASAYVLKGSEADELLLASKKVMAGKRYTSPPLADELFNEFVGILKSSRELDPYSTLSQRERDVLKLVAEGNTSRAIGARLFISVSTVKSHRVNISKKLKVHDIVGFIKVAMRNGLVKPD